MKPEVDDEEAQVQSRVQDRGGQAGQGAWGCRWRTPAVTSTVIRICCKWIKEFVADPAQAFPGHGQMKPEQREIERLRREVAKLKAERDILKGATP